MTNFFVNLYSWDRFITVSVVANICAVIWISVLAFRSETNLAAGSGFRSVSHWIGRRTVLVVACLGRTLGPLLSAHVAGAAPFNPTISVTPSSGRPGMHVTITGSGYPPQEIVALYIDQPSPYIGTPGPRTDAQGAFTWDLVWPDQKYDVARKVNPATPGAHTVCGDASYGGISQQYAAKTCAQFVAAAAPKSPVAQSPAPIVSDSSGPLLAGVIGGVAVLIALAAGVVFRMRRSG